MLKGIWPIAVLEAREGALQVVAGRDAIETLVQDRQALAQVGLVML